MPKTLKLDLCIRRGWDSRSNRKQLWSPCVKNSDWSIVLARSTWHAEQATTSGRVETTERSRERDPRSFPLKNFENIRRKTPKTLHSRAKHCWLVTCSATLFRAQTKKSWKTAYIGKTEPLKTVNDVGYIAGENHSHCISLFSPVKVAEGSLMFRKWTKSRTQISQDE